MNREGFPELLNSLNLTGIGVEVGANEGEFSELILKESKLSKLYSIDSWADLTGTKYSDPVNHTYAEHQQHKAVAVCRLAQFNGRSTILHMFSAQAVRQFENNSLDFIYVDAHHAYVSCKEDIELWYPKLSYGGVFAGHDYVADGLWNNGYIFGVMRAVDEFVLKCNLKLHTTDEEHWKSWYVIKK